MQLSKFSDYSFRTLIYLAKNQDKILTITFMSSELNISQNHLKKVVHKLSKGKFIESYKGRDGGIRLTKNPRDIILSNVLLYTEYNTDFVECLKENFNANVSNCPYHSDCNLKLIINNAKNAFIYEFSKFTLKDLLSNKSHICNH